MSTFSYNHGVAIQRRSLQVVEELRELMDKCKRDGVDNHSCHHKPFLLDRINAYRACLCRGCLFSVDDLVLITALEIGNRPNACRQATVVELHDKVIKVVHVQTNDFSGDSVFEDVPVELVHPCKPVRTLENGGQAEDGRSTSSVRKLLRRSVPTDALEYNTTFQVYLRCLALEDERRECLNQRASITKMPTESDALFQERRIKSELISDAEIASIDALRVAYAECTLKECLFFVGDPVYITGPIEVGGCLLGGFKQGVIVDMKCDCIGVKCQVNPGMYEIILFCNPSDVVPVYSVGCDYSTNKEYNGHPGLAKVALRARENRQQEQASSDYCVI